MTPFYLFTLLGAIHFILLNTRNHIFYAQSETNNLTYMLNTLCLSSYMLDYSYALYLSLTSYKPPLTCIAL
ncbi:hypothetical protein HanIR_Chr17g0863161 [Helianthus annuus]|nr:hypothetical protein HanIR_Chr17g0863161 [Helianthus annuus]